MPVDRNCEICGKHFTARPSKVRNGQGRFCSLSCANKDPNRNKPDQKGENNPNWKGGIAKDNYRYKKLQIVRYPKRVYARKRVNEAIKAGTLLREPCRECGTTQDIQGHHEDYSKPLDVIWLCRSCHRELHERQDLKKAA